MSGCFKESGSNLGCVKASHTFSVQQCFYYLIWLCFTILIQQIINPLNAKLNHICHLLALLRAHHILHVSRIRVKEHFNTLNAQLNPICHLLALLGAHHILHVSRIRVRGCLQVVLAVVRLAASIGYVMSCLQAVLTAVNIAASLAYVNPYPANVENMVSS